MSPVFAISTLVGIVLGILIMVGVALLFGVGVFNSLVTLRNRYKNAFSQIDVQLKRRYDLIPNLIEVAKGYMAHERGTLEAVVQARNQAVTAQQRAASNPGDPSVMTGLSAADGQVSGALSAVCSPWPRAIRNSRPTRTCSHFEEELPTSTENKVAFARPVVQRRCDEL